MQVRLFLSALNQAICIFHPVPVEQLLRAQLLSCLLHLPIKCILHKCCLCLSPSAELPLAAKACMTWLPVIHTGWIASYSQLPATIFCSSVIVSNHTTLGRQHPVFPESPSVSISTLNSNFLVNLLSYFKIYPQTLSSLSSPS